MNLCVICAAVAAVSVLVVTDPCQLHHHCRFTVG